MNKRAESLAVKEYIQYIKTRLKYMGDKVVIKKIEFIYGHLWQIDLYNETKKEHYRVFCENRQFETMQIQAKLEGWKNESSND